jgi:hypothetical protein
MGIRLEAGKRYVTRYGWITSPICEDLEAEENGTMRFYAGDFSWDIEGRVFRISEDRDDIVAEHVEVAVLPDVPDVPDVPDTDEQLVGNLMFEIGGQFVSSLARAYQFADSSNRQKIRNTFREYWMKYAELVAAEVSKANGGAN